MGILGTSKVREYGECLTGIFYEGIEEKAEKRVQQ
jgi:hypothetical protein